MNLSEGRDIQMRGLATLFFVAALLGCTKYLTPFPEPSTFPPPSPEDRIVGEKLKAVLENSVIYSPQINTGTFHTEYYNPNGSYIIRYVQTRKNLITGAFQREFTGTWRIESGVLCRETPALRQNACSKIYAYEAGIIYTSVTSTEVYAFSTRIEYQNEILTTLEPKIQVAPAPTAPAPQAVTTPQPAPQPPKTLKPVSSGSGFIVSDQTYVLTNEHVIEECAEVTVMIDDRDISAIVSARDRRNDLALLRLPAGKHPVAAFRGNSGLYPGDSVVAIGYPLSDILASEGNVSVGIVSALAGPGNDASLLQVSTPIQPGNSGGPLFDMSGNVVGVIVAQLGRKFFEADGTLPQNVNFAIKSAVATAFIQASGAEYKTRNSAEELRPADVARKGRPATVYIKCWK